MIPTPSPTALPARAAGLVVAVLVAGCASTPTAANPMLHAVAWLQTAAEYRAAAAQGYAAASRSLDFALADSSWTAALEQQGAYGRLPPAVVLDVDETVLDNSPYQVRLIADRESFDDESWGRWVREARADPVPGALAFTRAAERAGVTVFYVTNRDAPLEEATRRNLARHGFPLEQGIDVLLLRGERPSWGSDKGSRRAAVAERFRILLLIGDDLNDFASGALSDRAARRVLVDRHRERWGERWIVLPNPMYGSWERSLVEGTPRDGAEHPGGRMLEALEDRRPPPTTPPPPPPPPSP